MHPSISASDPASPAPLLSVRDLAVQIATERGVVRAVAGVSFDVPGGRTVALAGESGCGKTSIALAILRLWRARAAVTGRVLFGEQDLLRLPEEEMRRVRGGKIGMVFQDPLAALNPVHTIGAQIEEAARIHEPMSRRAARSVGLDGAASGPKPRRAARAQAIDMLRRAGFPEERAGAYPHELSGGMRQRALIAMALVARPALLIADEPTSALDTTVQVQILDLLRELRRELGMSLLIVAHDLALVAEIADDIVVLYAGRVVEAGPAARILAAPRHPYTRALVRSVPPAGAFRAAGVRRAPLPVIEGGPPDLTRALQGCRFRERCNDAFERCGAEEPPLFEDGAGKVRCFLHDPDSRGLS